MSGWPAPPIVRATRRSAGTAQPHHTLRARAPIQWCTCGWSMTSCVRGPSGDGAAGLASAWRTVETSHSAIVAPNSTASAPPLAAIRATTPATNAVTPSAVENIVTASFRPDCPATYRSPARLNAQPPTAPSTSTPVVAPRVLENSQPSAPRRCATYKAMTAPMNSVVARSRHVSRMMIHLPPHVQKPLIPTLCAPGCPASGQRPTTSDTSTRRMRHSDAPPRTRRSDLHVRGGAQQGHRGAGSGHEGREQQHSDDDVPGGCQCADVGSSSNKAESNKGGKQARDTVAPGCRRGANPGQFVPQKLARESDRSRVSRLRAPAGSSSACRAPSPPRRADPGPAWSRGLPGTSWPRSPPRYQTAARGPPPAARCLVVGGVLGHPLGIARPLPHLDPRPELRPEVFPVAQPTGSLVVPCALRPSPPAGHPSHPTSESALRVALSRTWHGSPAGRSTGVGRQTARRRVPAI